MSIKEHKRIFSSKRNRARQRGITFDLEFEDVLYPNYCPFLGIKLKYEDKSRNGKPTLDSAAFDRVDPSLGYVKGNVRIVSQAYNGLKGTASDEEIREILNNSVYWRKR